MCSMVQVGLNYRFGLQPTEDAAQNGDDLRATRSRCARPRGPGAPISATSLPAHLSFVNGAERSRALHMHHQAGLSHGSEPGKPHSRARLRDLDGAWVHPRPRRSALACGRARNLDGIDGHASWQARPTKEAPVACTFKDHQDSRAGRLISQMLGDSQV